MPGFPLRTRLTVASLTPACLATSARFRATAQNYTTNRCKACRPTALLPTLDRRVGRCDADGIEPRCEGEADGRTDRALRDPGGRHREGTRVLGGALRMAV